MSPREPVSERLARLTRTSKLKLHTDLAPHIRHGANDMVVDKQGRCYVGSFGFDRDAGEQPRSTELLLVEAPGTVRIVARDLWFPNGLAILSESRLVVAESYANRLTCFDIEPDGSLTNRRTFARLQGGPDGICTDQNGGVWVGCFLGDAFVRVIDGGEVTHRLDVPGRRAVACNLGGDDMRTLFCLTADTTLDALKEGRSSSRVEIARVEIAGTGSP